MENLVKPPPKLPPPLPAAGEHIAYHLARTATDLPTRKGVTYVWAGNGLFKHAWNGATRALVQLTWTHTPGLGELRPFVSWRGWADPLPAALLNEALADALDCYRPEAPQERQWFIVLRGGAPVLVTPEQQAGSAHLSYEMPHDQVLVDIHSHHGMAPFFSGTDDGDDTWLGLSLVIGRLGSPFPSAVARINCYGHHTEVDVPDLFAGALLAGPLLLASEREVRQREGLPPSHLFADLDDAPAFDKQAAIQGFTEPWEKESDADPAPSL